MLDSAYGTASEDGFVGTRNHSDWLQHHVPKAEIRERPRNSFNGLDHGTIDSDGGTEY